MYRVKNSPSLVNRIQRKQRKQRSTYVRVANGVFTWYRAKLRLRSLILDSKTPISAAAESEIRNFLQPVKPADSSVTDVQPSTSSQTNTSWTATPTTISTSLWEVHDNLEQTAAANKHDLTPYERELTSYIRESDMRWSTAIYAFWHCSQYAWTCSNLKPWRRSTHRDMRLAEQRTFYFHFQAQNDKNIL